MTSTDAPPAKGQLEHKPRLRFHTSNAVFAGVWLLMLAYPILSTLSREESLATKITFLLINAVFAVVYTGGFGLLASWRQRREDHLVWAWVILVLLCLAGIAVLIGFHIVNYTPWLMAMLCYGLPRRWGIPAGLVTAVVALGVTFLAFRGQYIFATYMLLVASCSAVIIPLALAVDFTETRKRDEQKVMVLRERERLARDVHDLLGHSLTVINLKAELARTLVDSDTNAVRAELEEIAHLSRTALAEARSTVTRIERPDFAGEVSAALRALSTAGIQAELPDPDSAQRISGVNAQLYSWVLREAVTNIIRHSSASACHVLVTPEQLEITDNGRGMGEVEPGNHLGGGLRGLTRRAEEAGGQLIITPAQPSGTRVLLTMSGDKEAPSRKMVAPINKEESAHE